MEVRTPYNANDCIALERICLTADERTAVASDSPDAAVLLVAEGGTIHLDYVERYGLTVTKRDEQGVRYVRLTDAPEGDATTDSDSEQNDVAAQDASDDNAGRDVKEGDTKAVEEPAADKAHKSAPANKSRKSSGKKRRRSG